MNTLNHSFQDTVARNGAKTALRHKVARVFQDITYAELGKMVADTASGLASLGVAKGDRVAILSENRPEWAVADHAVLALGGVVVPIYPTLPEAQIAYIARDSGAKALIVSDAKQLKKGLGAKRELPGLEFLIAMEPGSDDTQVLSFAKIGEMGREKPLGDAGMAARRDAVQPEDVASIVYTSGTTGDPKGAMLTHGNFISNIDGALTHFKGQGELIVEGDTFLSFLPVCHVFERTTGYYLPIRVGATIAYSEGVRTLVDDMAAAKPTIMVCVPRVYEAMQERIEDTAAKAPEKRQKLFRQALAVGAAWDERRRSGQNAGPILGLKRFVFEKLVYVKLRTRFGGTLRFFVSGGAALNVETARFFGSIGLPIIEGYGMTESSPVMAINPNRRVKIGTVGTVIPGGEMKIAPDGEIVYRGANVMKGYWNNAVATAEMIDEGGWLHTGDVGQIDAEGYLKITDRKKDILVLANGKNVAPQPIEAKLKQSPFLSEVVLLGDKQSIITALVIPNKSRLADWAKSQNLVWPDGDEDALLALPEVRRKVKSEIDAHSKDLADFEKVKKFTLLNAVFSVDTGEMTPTLKVKRKVIAQKYAREISAMRGGEDAG